MKIFQREESQLHPFQQAGKKAWREQNYIMPGFTYYWQNAAFIEGWNKAQDEFNAELARKHRENSK